MQNCGNVFRGLSLAKKEAGWSTGWLPVARHGKTRSRMGHDLQRVQKYPAPKTGAGILLTSPNGVPTEERQVRAIIKSFACDNVRFLVGLRPFSGTLRNDLTGSLHASFLGSRRGIQL